MMLRLEESYLWLPGERLRKWCSILPVMHRLANIFSPAISLIAFRLNFDKHLVGCQHHRQHVKDGTASGIRVKMVPEAAETVPGRTVHSIYFSRGLFFQNHLFIPTARCKYHTAGIYLEMNEKKRSWKVQS